MSVFVAVLRNFLVYLSDDTRDRQYGKKKVQLAKTPQFAICIQPILLFWYFDCDCLSYFKCADSSEICPPLLFIWGWLDINCVPNLCYSSKQTLPNPPHFQISKHILEFNHGCRSRKSPEFMSSSWLLFRYWGWLPSSIFNSPQCSSSYLWVCPSPKVFTVSITHEK